MGSLVVRHSVDVVRIRHDSVFGVQNNPPIRISGTPVSLFGVCYVLTYVPLYLDAQRRPLFCGNFGGHGRLHRNQRSHGITRTYSVEFFLCRFRNYCHDHDYCNVPEPVVHRNVGIRTHLAGERRSVVDVYVVFLGIGIDGVAFRKTSVGTESDGPIVSELCASCTESIGGSWARYLKEKRKGLFILVVYKKKGFRATV